MKSITEEKDEVLTREKILRRLPSAENPGKCIVHASIDDLLASIDRTANEFD
ncbi:MAG: hypothetical protein LBT98_03770 [Puniceicoccales bacterium]|jgi:hypothetical protein|nr:hypothetical protein [Puniceicoccales bacterium]